MTKNKLFNWGFVLVWMGVIFFLSHQDGTASSSTSSWATNLVRTVIINVRQDKLLEDIIVQSIREIAHFFLYFILGGLLYNAMSVTSVLDHLTTLGLGMLYALSDEWHQSFVVGRAFEIKDLVIDTLGLLSALLLLSLISLLFKRK